MRYQIVFGCVVVSLVLCGCNDSARDPDGPGNPSPPVPLKQVVMHDIQGLWGGEAIWITSDCTAIIQVIESGQKEKRCRAKISAEGWTEIERLVGANDFLNLKIKERTAVPDEIHPIVAIVTKNDERAHVRKLGNDYHPRFDALYGYLRGVCRSAQDRKLIHEGKYDWNWRPDGFEKLW